MVIVGLNLLYIVFSELSLGVGMISKYKCPILKGKLDFGIK